MKKEDRIEFETIPEDKNRIWKILIVILIIGLVIGITFVISLNVYNYISRNQNSTNSTEISNTNDSIIKKTEINVSNPKISVCGDGKCNGTENYANCARDCRKANNYECIPDCSGKECGDDSCGDYCGYCDLSEICSAAGKCLQQINCTADINCTSFTGICATRKCNTTTKQCYSSFNASTNVCRSNVSECDAIEFCSGSNANCGSDFNKSDGALCSIGTCTNGKCVKAETCIPDCTGKVCGNDRCGGVCLPGCASGYYCNSNGQCEERVIKLTNNISQYGITWYFDKDYEYGQFVNGDYWVKTDERGLVNITRITPDFFYDGKHYYHGWQVNPSSRLSQGFDSRTTASWIGAFSFSRALVPNLSYAASGNQSIIKAGSREPLSDAGLRPLIKTAAVLTVLDYTPQNNGANVFRPPFTDANKKAYNADRIDWSILPSLVLNSNIPSTQSFLNSGNFKGVQIEYFSNGGLLDYIHPLENMPNDGGAIATRNGNIALRLMLNDPLENKKNLTIAYLQYGIDLYHSGIGGTKWSPDGQIFIGRKLPIAFAAVMLNDNEMKEFVRNANDMQFQENGVFHTGKNEVLWSLNKSTYWNEWRYWEELINGPNYGGKVGPDPYGFIDGSSVPGETYLTSGNSMQSKKFALAIRLMPQLREVWNDEELLRFADRWTYHGAWTQPDACAPPTGVCKAGTLKAGQPCTMANANLCNNGGLFDCDYPSRKSIDYGIKYGPNSTNPGNCILDTDSSDGIGRVPFLHGKNKNTGQGTSAWTELLWNTYRGEACFNGYCNTAAGENKQNCPYDCK